MPFGKKRPKHEPIDRYFYLAIQIAKCMMRYYTLSWHDYVGLCLWFSCTRNLSGVRFPTSSACRFTATVAPPTSSPLLWLSVLLERYRCHLDVNGRFTYYLNHLAPLCAALRRSRVAQCHQGVVGGVPKPSYLLLS